MRGLVLMTVKYIASMYKNLIKHMKKSTELYTVIFLACFSDEFLALLY